MESMIDTIQSQINTSTHHRIRVRDLHSILEQLPKAVKVLSLDCFDTLIWRTLATPADAFYLMQHQPAFKTAGLTGRMRRQSEQQARHQLFYETGKSEVNLEAIYGAYNAAFKEDEIANLRKDELSIEQQVCFAYPPMLAFIRAAKKRGLKIILVSDTYFSQNEMRTLLQACLPQDVYAMIEQIYPSSQYGYGKSAGLFKYVLEDMKLKPGQIYHLGDNLMADFVAPQLLGIPASHLYHYEQKIEEMNRMHALAAGLLDHDIRHTRAMVNPFNGIFANPSLDKESPEVLIGYYSIGPIMYAFSQYIMENFARLKARHQACKLAFLLRDGYLPSLACAAYLGSEAGVLLRISRFTSYAASFRNVSDIDRYVSETVKSMRFHDICNQLLLPVRVANKICEKAKKARQPVRCFIDSIHDEPVVKMILDASQQFRKRLIRHIQTQANVEKGDTLMFVDLGYKGTSQIRLAPILRDELNVEIAGCYLLALDTPADGSERHGLFDTSWCDERTLHTLIQYIALLEQMSTLNECSVIDYQEEGSPVYATHSVSKDQHKNLEKIQAAVIQFIKDARKFLTESRLQVSNEVLRDYALAELCRFLYFPTDVELNYLKSFEFEVNMGVHDILNVLDEEKGLQGLRKRGMFFMERNLKSMRTNYPSELRAANIELTMMLLQSHRVEFDMRVNDFSLRRESLHVIAIHDTQTTQLCLDAMPTHDGYYSLIIPVGCGDYQVGIHFGKNYKLVQIESAEVIPANCLYGSRESENTVDVSTLIMLDQMTDHGDGLFSCDSDTGLLIYASQNKLGDGHYMLRVVYRPIS